MRARPPRATNRRAPELEAGALDNDQKDRLRRLVAGAGLDDTTTRQVTFYARL